MNIEDITAILTSHQLWLDDNSEGCCANLAGANLMRANLAEANLTRANLAEANLMRANLDDVDFGCADLRAVTWPERTLVLGPAGSRGDSIVYRMESDQVHAGCWSGTLAEFERRVADVYPDDQLGYDGIIKMLRAITGPLAESG